MNETNWGESDATPPPPKKRIPTWLWFCGGGCLLATILGIVALAWIASRFKGATDPEVQWPLVAQVLPYDTRPSELTLLFGVNIKMEMFVFEDSRGFKAALFRFREGDTEETRRTLLNPEYKGGVLGVGEREGIEPVKIRIQGRDIAGVRFLQMRKQHAGKEQTDQGVGDANGPSVLLDLSPEGDRRLTVLQLVREDGHEPIKEDEVRAFLKPFHVGPDR